MQRARGARAVGLNLHVQVARLHVRISSAPNVFWRAPKATRAPGLVATSRRGAAGASQPVPAQDRKRKTRAL
eukprot:15453247-Alexandrium_andersonii.AAC.1